MELKLKIRKLLFINGIVLIVPFMELKQKMKWQLQRETLRLNR